MNARVWVSPRAAAQIDDAASWWRVNRTAAPDLFVREIAGALALLAQAPKAGRHWRHPRVRGVRRLLIPSTRYHVYYVVGGEEGGVEMGAVWSGAGGRAPTIEPR